MTVRKQMNDGVWLNVGCSYRVKLHFFHLPLRISRIFRRIIILVFLKGLIILHKVLHGTLRLNYMKEKVVYLRSCSHLTITGNNIIPTY